MTSSASSSSITAIPTTLSSLIREKLIKDNYMLWHTQVMPTIRTAELEGCLTGDEKPPAKTHQQRRQRSGGSAPPQSGLFSMCRTRPGKPWSMSPPALAPLMSRLNCPSCTLPRCARVSHTGVSVHAQRALFVPDRYELENYR
jgi:hypothetical protein